MQIPVSHSFCWPSQLALHLYSTAKMTSPFAICVDVITSKSKSLLTSSGYRVTDSRGMHTSDGKTTSGDRIQHKTAIRQPETYQLLNDDA